MRETAQRGYKRSNQRAELANDDGHGPVKFAGVDSVLLLLLQHIETEWRDFVNGGVFDHDVVVKKPAFGGLVEWGGYSLH